MTATSGSPLELLTSIHILRENNSSINAGEVVQKFTDLTGLIYRMFTCFLLREQNKIVYDNEIFSENLILGNRIFGKFIFEDFFEKDVFIND